MKNLIILASILVLTFIKMNAQTTLKSDTMSITINGERLILPVPKSGSKTTINMEDSASIIQVSVSKIAKSQLQTNPLAGTNLIPVEKTLPVKHVSWFSEIDFGSVVFVNRKTYSTGSLYDYTIGMSGVNRTRVTFIPRRVNAGITAGLVIREKRRSIGHNGLIFISGSRFRYSRYTGSGDYKITELKTSNNGMDSILSSNTGEFKSATNNYQFIFPFMLEGSLNKKAEIKMSLGVNIIFNIHSTKYTENLRNTNANISYNNTQMFIVQPMLKTTYKSSSIYFAYSLGKTRIGEGLNTTIEGNMLYMGLAYKLY